MNRDAINTLRSGDRLVWTVDRRVFTVTATRRFGNRVLRILLQPATGDVIVLSTSPNANSLMTLDQFELEAK